MAQETATCQLAQVLPHALNGGNGESLKLRTASFGRFDPGVRHSPEGNSIDEPHNAIMLHSELHTMFRQLLWWFEEVQVCFRFILSMLSKGLPSKNLRY